MLLGLKLLLTPVLAALLTLATRRWGTTVGGVLAGLPLVSGPASFFFALQYGVGFAHAAVVGTLLALIGVTACIVTYGRLARRLAWPWCVAAALFAYVVVIAVIWQLEVPIAGAAALALTVLIAAILTTAKLVHSPAPRRISWSELALRAVIATSLILAVTAVAGVVGPVLAGAIAPFPVVVMVLTAFTHRHEGGAGAAALLRGVLVSLPAFVGFFLVVGYGVERWSLASTYGAATLVGLGFGAAVIVPRHVI
jgi:hypothetical protein